MTPPRIVALHLQNFRSARDVLIEFDRITYLVGPNAAGKSNVIDGLQFIRDALADGLDRALDRRGGAGKVRFREGKKGRPSDLSFEVVVALPRNRHTYSFSLRVTEGGRYRVLSERLIRGESTTSDATEVKVLFDRQEREDGGSYQGLPRRGIPDSDQLMLPLHGSRAEIRPLWKALTEVQSYNIAPDRFKNPTDDSPWKYLARDGANLAWILARLERKRPGALVNIVHYLKGILAGVTEVGSLLVGERRVPFIKQRRGQSELLLESVQCSDGTLRCIGLLVALFQEPRLGMVALEEPAAGR
ncbi:MAG: AAA family ATPase [Candidatus Riflebacteria bacterium]|nr:AAA family ATPase [Candidatus Riflebacteria bacterium]